MMQKNGILTDFIPLAAAADAAVGEKAIAALIRESPCDRPWDWPAMDCTVNAP